MQAVNRAAQARCGGFGALASHQRSLAAIHSGHCLAHAAFALARVHRNTGKRAAGQHEQEHQRCKSEPHGRLHSME